MNDLILLEVSIDKADDMYDYLIDDLRQHSPKLKGRKGNYRDGKKHFHGMVNERELDHFLLLTKASPWGAGYEYGYIRNNRYITD